jgi:hypothetical protein
MVSQFNVAGNPVLGFVFRNANGTTTTISSPDPGRALITGIANDQQDIVAFLKLLR